MSDLQAKLARLKELARKATKGPWLAEPDTCAGRVWVRRPSWLGKHGGHIEPLYQVHENGETKRTREQMVADATYVAACDPDTILSLIQAAERGMEYENLAEKWKNIAQIAYAHLHRGADTIIIATGKSWNETYLEALASDPPQGKEENNV